MGAHGKTIAQSIALGNARLSETMNGKGVRSGAPRRIRTSDTRVRSPVLYPAELWTRSGPGFTEHRLETQEESARQFNRSSSKDVLGF